MSDGCSAEGPAAPLSCDGVTVRIDGRTLLDQVSLELRAGQLVAVVGPNGAGKSTLLRVLAGELTPDEGEVRCGGVPLGQVPVRDRAVLRSVLAQQTVLRFGFTVAEVIEMGRHPHRGRSSPEQDRAIVGEAAARFEVDHLVDRVYPSLSGGEQRRASLARVLAQQTPTVLLDEPTAALDVRHQELAMAAAARVADDGGAVVAVVHDLSLAAAWVDRIVLVDAGRIVADGPPRRALRADQLSHVYGYPLRVVADEDGVPLVLPDRGRRVRGAPGGLGCAPTDHRSTESG